MENKKKIREEQTRTSSILVTHFVIFKYDQSLVQWSDIHFIAAQR